LNEKEQYIKAFRLMATAKAMAELYEQRKDICAKYVHATSRGHEAIQLAAAFQLKSQDFVFPYYRDDSILLGIGFTPFDLMLQIFAKRTDFFSGGRTYYAHPSSNRADLPKIPHQSSATGMQAIPATGVAQGLQYKEQQGLVSFERGEEPIVICSLGDASVTEGEISEALQMAVLHSYPIVFLVQDNEWDISAHSSEVRAMNAAEYAKGFKGLRAISIDGADFQLALETMRETVEAVRKDRKPFLVHAKVPLLNHHTSGVRKEWYRPIANLESDADRDPYPRLVKYLVNENIATKSK
jgi:2-oxoisovalerate dehydrogenase E1 component